MHSVLQIEIHPFGKQGEKIKQKQNNWGKRTEKRDGHSFEYSICSPVHDNHTCSVHECYITAYFTACIIAFAALCLKMGNGASIPSSVEAAIKVLMIHKCLPTRQLTANCIPFPLDHNGPVQVS